MLKYNKIYKDVNSKILFEFNKQDNILISIIIPTYKRLQSLKTAVNSAVNQNNKSLLSYEIIIVDNDSGNLENSSLENEFSEFSESTLRYYVNEENIGMMGNWNRGIELASGEYVIQLHDDDYFLPYFIETAYSSLLKFSKKDCLVFVPAVHDKRKQQDIVVNNQDNGYLKLNSLHVVRANYHITGALIKKKVVEEIGGFNLEKYPISDYDFNQKLIKKYNVISILSTSLAVIIFEQNETLNPKVFEKWFYLEKEIKENAIKNYNFVFKYFLKKVIKVQVNKDIDYMKNEIIINEKDKLTFDDKYFKVNKFDYILWKNFLRTLFLYDKIFRKC